MLLYMVCFEAIIMELIMIKDMDNDILLYLDNDKYYGYANYNDIDISNYFNYFRLSDNCKIIGNYDKYNIVLDNNTGLKHYISNNIDNMELLFLNNGINCILYKNNGSNDTKYKMFRFKNIVITITCLGLIMANGIMINGRIKNDNIFSYDTTCDYQLEDIYNMIYSSSNLDSQEKYYLYNEDFFNDVLEYINRSDFLKYKYRIHFNNIEIRGDHKNFDEDSSDLGYYLLDRPNTLFVKNYNELTERNKDTVAHEFIHLCQDITGYNLIIEACAEIISHEYYSNNNNRYSYHEQVRLVKKLMEIIGSDVVWYYNFTGDFSKIEERIRPYLNSNEYKEFLNDLTFDYDDYTVNRIKFNSLDGLLSRLYKSIYNDDIENNKVISLIDMYDNSLVRYYFNDRYDSYYYDKSQGEYMDISYEEAVDEKLIFIYAINKEPISKEEAFELKDSHLLYREIDYRRNEISVYGSLYTPRGLYISAIIDGKRYEKVSVDDLVKDGIIDVNYYKSDTRLLSASEYLNNEYDDESEIVILKASDNIVLKEDSVYAFISKKVSIPSVNENYNNAKVKVKDLDNF